MNAPFHKKGAFHYSYITVDQTRLARVWEEKHMSISSDQYMQKMETGMVDVRQCVIKMEASLQKLVADSKAMQQLVKQSLVKDKQGAAAGKSDAGADAKKGDAAKGSTSDTIISSLSRKLADGIGGAILKMLGLEEKKKDASAGNQAQGAGTGAGSKNDKSENKEKADSLKGKSSLEIMQKAIEDFGGSAEDANKRIYDSMSVALKSSSDALVKFVSTGKLNFSDLAKSIISDIMKIQAKAAIAGLAQFLLGSAVSFFGGGTTETTGTANFKPNVSDNWGLGSFGDISGLSAGSSSSGFRFTPSGAGGFDIPAGVNPVTQLHEKEMVLPAQYADVIRGLANNGAAGDGININTSVSVSNDGTSNQKSDGGNSSQRQLANMINDQTRAVIAREMRQGGLIWNMRMGVA